MTDYVRGSRQNLPQWAKGGVRERGSRGGPPSLLASSQACFSPACADRNTLVAWVLCGRGGVLEPQTIRWKNIQPLLTLGLCAWLRSLSCYRSQKWWQPPALRHCPNRIYCFLLKNCIVSRMQYACQAGCSVRQFLLPVVLSLVLVDVSTSTVP